MYKIIIVVFCFVLTDQVITITFQHSDWFKICLRQQYLISPYIIIAILCIVLYLYLQL